MDRLILEGSNGDTFTLALGYDDEKELELQIHDYSACLNPGQIGRLITALVDVQKRAGYA